MEWSEHGNRGRTRRHGETDIILEVVTESRGRHLGLVRGGRSRRLRPVLQPGNTLALTWRARLHEHLGTSTWNRWWSEAGPSSPPARRIRAGAGAAHLRLLPERDPHPRLFAALSTLLDNFDPPELAAELMARFELLLLDELGFGLDLESCAATGQRDQLPFVSPKSGRAVSREAGRPYADRLLPLPGISPRAAGESCSTEAMRQAFLLTGYFLERHVFDARGEGLPEVRLNFLKAVSAAARAPDPSAGDRLLSDG
jgi:DNA repair protein RecO (recombination protein O)